jgi:hypothetical protein
MDALNQRYFLVSGKGKTILSIPEIFKFFNGCLEFASFPQNNYKSILKCLHPLGM